MIYVNRFLHFNKLTTIIFSINLAMLGLILLDSISYTIPIIRQVIGFIYLSFVPGFLILRLLKYYGHSIIPVFLYSVGLSLSFLMFYGFSINFLYEVIGATNPFSLYPLFFGITLVVLFLLFLNYMLIDKDFSFSMPYDKKTVYNYKLLCPKTINLTLFAFLLLFLSIYGTYLVNYYSSTIILFILLFFISLMPMLVFSIYRKEKLNLYIVVLLISLSLLFHNSLISLYLTGADVHFEYFYSKLVVTNNIWDSSISSNLNAMLTVVSLAPIYSLILNLELTWIYKILYQLFFSLVPLGLYYVFKEQTSKEIAFFSIFFYIAVFPFYTEMVQLPRQQIAEFFVTLYLVLLIDSELVQYKKSILSIIFILSLVVSHYGLSYLFILMLIFSFVIKCSIESIFYRVNESTSHQFLLKIAKWRLFLPEKNRSLLSLYLVAITIIFALTWYMTFSNSSCFISVVSIGSHILGSITELFTPSTSQSLGMIMHNFSFYHEITKYIHLISQVFIIIGFVFISLTNKRNYSFSNPFLYLASSNLFILFLALALPFFSSSLNTTRVYQITLSFLAPFFAIGATIFFQQICVKTNIVFRLSSLNSEKISGYLVASFLCAYFLFNSGFVYELVGDDSVSISLNQNFDYPYFNQKEAHSASWLVEHGSKKVVYLDVYSIWFFQDFLPTNFILMQLDSIYSMNSYLYLRSYNLDTETISITTHENEIVKTQILNLGNVSYYTKSNKIYVNGGSDVMLMQ